MKSKEIKHQPVTIIPTADSYNNQKNTTIDVVLNQLCPMWAERIESLRMVLKEKGKEEYRKQKVKFPVWFPCGTVAPGNCKDSGMLSYTGLIALDIDVKEGENDQVDIEWVRKSLFSQPWVFAALKSIGGNGLYILVLVEDTSKINAYFHYFQIMLKNKYGIDLDMAATNPARKRFISYDPDMQQWIKADDQEITPWKLYLPDTPIQQKSFSENKVRRHPEQLSIFSEDLAVADTKKAMELLINRYGFSIDYYNGSNESKYHTWWYVGNDIKSIFGTSGEELFLTFSHNSANYKDEDADLRKRFKECDACKAHQGDDIHIHWQGIAKRIIGPDWKKK